MRPTAADVARLWDSDKRVVKPRAKLLRPLTRQEAGSAVFRWLVWICGYRRKAVMARLYGLSHSALWKNAKGAALPRPATWRRLCRDADWRRNARFVWGNVVDRTYDQLQLADGSLLPLDAMPGPLDELPDHHDLMGSMGVVSAMSRSQMAEMIGLRLVDGERWRRFAEVKLWDIVGYPVVMLSELDWEERHATWDPDYTFRAKQGYRNLSLPTDPFDLIRSALP